METQRSVWRTSDVRQTYVRGNTTLRVGGMCLCFLLYFFFCVFVITFCYFCSLQCYIIYMYNVQWVVDINTFIFITVMTAKLAMPRRRICNSTTTHISTRQRSRTSNPRKWGHPHNASKYNEHRIYDSFAFIYHLCETNKLNEYYYISTIYHM